MSRSYKKTPIIKDSSPYYKNQANRLTRRTKGIVLKGATYKKLYPQYDVCDFIIYPYKPIWLMSFNERKDYISK